MSQEARVERVGLKYQRGVEHRMEGTSGERRVIRVAEQEEKYLTLIEKLIEPNLRVHIGMKLISAERCSSLTRRSVKSLGGTHHL